MNDYKVLDSSIIDIENEQIIDILEAKIECLYRPYEIVHFYKKVSKNFNHYYDLTEKIKQNRLLLCIKPKHEIEYKTNTIKDVNKIRRNRVIFLCENQIFYYLSSPSYIK